MAVFKCKMCGGDLVVDEDSNVVECEYCGTAQTVPSGDDEKKARLFNRANRLRLGNGFDKAMSIYENIIAEYPEEAEAFWGLCLCKYGIEYVDDPATAKKIPTCHRTCYESIFEDDDFEQALEYSDSVARTVYRNEAKEIDRLQKAILEIVESEEPYDIFICYKETDENGERTNDSVLAQDMYDALTAKGYRVFFSRVSLENKLGREYEPYIFAALNSAKVMLAVGTDYENFNAAWVKNEWSRFLDLMKKDKTKVLIPCYRDIDAYDMPPEFKNLQGQDMGKVGFMQDLVRGIDKIMKEETPVAKTEAPAPVSGPNVTALLQRGMMALEDGEWEKAKEFFDQVLSMDAKCFDAYFGMGMADNQIKDKDAFDEVYVLSNSVLHQDKNIIRAVSFSNDEQRTHFKELEEKRKADRKKATERIEQAKKTVRNGVLDGGLSHTVGLCEDGTVVATGADVFGQCQVSEWKDIIAISAGAKFTMGLRNDGTVVATEEWYVFDENNIIAIAAGGYYTVGLREDGTVVAVGNTSDGRCQVSEWKDIIAIAAGGYHTVGLREDGTVVAVGNNSGGSCQVSEWKDIIAIAAGESHTVGLRADGTVVAAGRNDSGQCKVDSWKLFYLEEEKERLYNLAKHEMGLSTERNYRAAVEHFCKIADYKDSKELRIQCEKKCNELARQRLKAEKIAEIDSKITRLTNENEKLIEQLAGLKGLKGLGSGTLKGELNRRLENNENELYSLKRQRSSLEEV